MTIVIPIGKAPINKRRRRCVTWVCAACGSEDVVRDAYAEWDIVTQKWVLKSVCETAECRNCDSETTLVEVPI